MVFKHAFMKSIIEVERFFGQYIFYIILTFMAAIAAGAKSVAAEAANPCFKNRRRCIAFVLLVPQFIYKMFKNPFKFGFFFYMFFLAGAKLGSAQVQRYQLWST